MRRSTKIVLAKIGVSIILLGVLIHQIDFSDAFARILGINPVFLAAAAGFVVIQVLLNTVRWLTILRPLGGKLPYPSAARMYFTGFFFDQFLPSSIGGDAVRMYLARRAGLPLDVSVNGVLLERALILVALVLVLIAVQPVLFPAISSPIRELQLVAVSVMALCLTIGLVALVHFHRLPTWKPIKRITDMIAYTAKHARIIVLNYRNNIPALAIAFVCLLNNVTIIFMLEKGLGIELTYFQTLYLFLPVVLFMIIPLSIAGWGVRESAFVTIYTFAGVTGESALALSVVVGLLMIATSIPGGVAWLLGGGFTVRAVAANTEELAHAQKAEQQAL